MCSNKFFNLIFFRPRARSEELMVVKQKFPHQMPDAQKTKCNLADDDLVLRKRMQSDSCLETTLGLLYFGIFRTLIKKKKCQEAFLHLIYVHRDLCKYTCLQHCQAFHFSKEKQHKCFDKLFCSIIFQMLVQFIMKGS